MDTVSGQTQANESVKSVISRAVSVKRLIAINRLTALGPNDTK